MIIEVRADYGWPYRHSFLSYIWLIQKGHGFYLGAAYFACGTAMMHTSAPFLTTLSLQCRCHRLRLLYIWQCRRLDIELITADISLLLTRRMARWTQLLARCRKIFH